MWANYDDVLKQITAFGLLIDKPLEVDTTGPIRTRIDGRRGKPGWYRLYTLPPVSGGQRALLTGAYGYFQGDENIRQTVTLRRDDRSSLTKDQIDALRQRLKTDREDSERRARAAQELAARRAAAWWRQCRTAGESGYLTRKGFDPGMLYNSRLSPSGNTVVPLQDPTGEVWSLQVIYNDPEVCKRKGRDKDFAPPRAVTGGRYFVIGGLSSGCLALVCEGFATGASLHAATGFPVIVAFTAGNLLAVAKVVTHHYRGSIRLLFCADDDYDWQQNGKTNTGVVAAKNAALAVDGRVVIPVFPGERPLHTHKGPTDFNDLHTHPRGGLHAVRAQVEASLSAAGWSGPQKTWTAGVDSDGGAGKPSLRADLTVDDARQRWALIYGAKDTLFDFAEHCLVPKSCVLDLLPDHAWRLWKRSGLRVHRLSEVGFDPTGKDSDVKCNLWAGWPTVPKEGCCDNLLELLRYLCSGDPDGEAVYQWALKWMAFPIQNPGAKMATSLVFHGPMGTGKNLLFESYMAIYGPYGRVIDQDAVEDKYNDWASRRLLLVADEVVASSDRWHVKNKLKCFITGQWIRINPKHVAAHDERNHVNLVMLSNEHLPNVIERGDRRYLVVWTPRELSPGFYRDVKEEVEAGGIAALHHYLLNLPLGDFNEHSKPPLTKAKADVQQLSASSVERFIAAWTAGELPHPLCPCTSAQLYLAYTRYCSANGDRPRPHNHVSGFVGKESGFEIVLRYIDQTFSGKAVKTRVVVPPPDLLYSKNPGAVDYRKPPDKKETQWLSDCVAAFGQSLDQMR